MFSFPIHRVIIAALLGLGLLHHAIAADKPVIESVKLQKADVITRENRSHEVIDAKSIAGPVSIHLTNCSDVTITDCDLASVSLALCHRVTIRNCYIHDSPECGVDVYRCDHVLVQGCRIERVASGVYALESQQIQVLGNFARNLMGPFPRGQMAQFNNVTGADNFIRGNYAINEFHKSNHEDVINLFQSKGEKDSPILVEANYLCGDPVHGCEGMSKTGSGIMLGDTGGAWQVCRRNIVLSAGQAGIGVAGGSFIRVEDNLIYGQKSDVSNQGLYVWNQSKQPSDHVAVLRNRVSWIAHDGGEASWWNGGGIQDVEEKDNHFYDATLSAQLPPPPSRAPMPPHPWATSTAQGKELIRLPWSVD